MLVPECEKDKKSRKKLEHSHTKMDINWKKCGKLFLSVQLEQNTDKLSGNNDKISFFFWEHFLVLHSGCTDIQIQVDVDINNRGREVLKFHQITFI